MRRLLTEVEVVSDTPLDVDSHDPASNEDVDEDND